MKLTPHEKSRYSSFETNEAEEDYDYLEREYKNVFDDYSNEIKELTGLKNTDFEELPCLIGTLVDVAESYKNDFDNEQERADIAVDMQEIAEKERDEYANALHELEGMVDCDFTLDQLREVISKALCVND